MEFAQMVQQFTSTVQARDGAAFAQLFTEDGVYHDTFYGEFKGRERIQYMIDVMFYKHAEDFAWKMVDPVSDGKLGYARWEFFRYTSTMPQSPGKKVIAEGVSCFQLDGGLVRHYREFFPTGVAFSQLGMKGSAMEKVYGKWARAFLESPSAARALKG